ncbi:MULTISPECIES: hypothetical protein [Mycobacteriaceae]|nr:MULTISPECIES: hypothetical protein [Mycobacteriaceae]AXK75391.1 hypothetical protein DXK33_10015 [Mycolicibacterium neoaurum]
MALRNPAMLGAVLAVAAMASAGFATAEPPAPSPAPADPSAPAVDPAPAPAPVPATVIDKDGTYRVGVDIVPGVYASAGPFPDGTCSWRRMAPAVDGAEQGETLDRAFTKQPQVVQVLPTDGVFKTTECQTWTLTDQQPPAPGVGPLLAGLQVRGYLDSLNRNAQQYEANKPPAPPAPAPPTPAP